jgi:HlyD family secretion protein
MMMRVKLLTLALTAALAIGLPQMTFAQAEETEAVVTAPVLPAITVSTVGRDTVRDRVIVSGLIGPIEQVQVAPLVEGQPVESLLADVGDMVTAGQVLATLSTTTLELQVSQNNASLASARATIAQADAQLLEAQSTADEAVRVNTRTASLREQGTASQAAADTAAANAISATTRVTVAAQSLEAARAQLALVEAQMANAALSLERTKVVAPVSGTIVQRNATIGSIATAAGDPMFIIVKDNALELRGDVAEIDLIRLDAGQPASLRLVGSIASQTGKVRLVEPTVDATTRLGRVRVTIDDSSAVRSGMFAEAEVIAAEHDAIVVPVTALGATNGQPTVMKVADGLVTRVPVTPGIRDGDIVEIIEGLVVGDTVVTRAGAFVRDGDRINPVVAASN